MIDPQTAAVLQSVLRRQSRSFLQFIGEAFPWTAADEQAALAKLQTLIQEDRQATAVLGRFLLRHRIELPYLGTYPEPFTSLSFLSFDYLVPRLVGEERRALQNLEADVVRIADPEARAAVQRILDVKRRHLPLLEEMAAAHTQPVLRT